MMTRPRPLETRKHQNSGRLGSHSAPWGHRVKAKQSFAAVVKERLQRPLEEQDALVAGQQLHAFALGGAKSGYTSAISMIEEQEQEQEHRLIIGWRRGALSHHAAVPWPPARREEEEEKQEEQEEERSLVVLGLQSAAGI